MIERTRLAERIVQEMRSELKDANVTLRGSLASNTADDFSDIDIGIQSAKKTDKELVCDIGKIMQNNHQVLFVDYARSLLPKECIISFFISEIPVHWQVDFEVKVLAKNRLLSPSGISYEYPDHFLKLWVGVSKHVARSTEGCEQEACALYQKITGKEYIPVWSSVRFLKESLRSLKKDSNDKYKGFIDRCNAIMKNVEQGFCSGAQKARAR